MSRTSISVAIEDSNRLKKMFPSLSSAMAIRAILDLISENNGEVNHVLMQLIVEKSESRESIKRNAKTDSQSINQNIEKKDNEAWKSFEPEKPEVFFERYETEEQLEEIKAKGVTSVPSWMNENAKTNENTYSDNAHDYWL